ncbi:MAG: UDP-N-acetylglucosamine 2-epimerase (non-hydrolyzing) [Patescibacteria group bacterium]
MKKTGKRIRAVVVVGARPNFMKAAPLLRAMKKYREIEPILVHTGQHYDFLMSEAFFRDLKMPKPDVYLGVGSMERNRQIKAISAALREHFQKNRPDIVIVVGDVNSTLAAARAAKALGVKVAHVEAGLRSGDLAMPEEINRIETDKISDFLFITEKSADANLRKEKVAGKVYFTGNTMIDSLKAVLPKIRKASLPKAVLLPAKKYAVLTLHRPSNVDDKKRFLKILDSLYAAQKGIGGAKAVVSGKTGEFKILFPIHPRTKKRVEEFNLPARFGRDFFDSFVFCEPLRYAPFIRLVKNAKLVITDSGGIQEETTYLGVPCLTLRDSTERPVTVAEGTNILVKPGGADFSGRLQKELKKIFAGKSKKGRVPEKWDGRAAERTVRVLKTELA